MITIENQRATVIASTDSPYEDAADLIANIAGTCYQKMVELERSISFCEHLIERGHESPFEFYSLTFELTTSRAVSHELVRHRIASYMQESQRFCSYRNALPVIHPVGLPTDPASPVFKTWHSAMEAAWTSYNALLDQGVKKEDARVVLPNATVTHLKATFNLRSFRNFIDLRTSPSAWASIRELAHLMASSAVAHDRSLEYLLADVWHKG